MVNKDVAKVSQHLQCIILCIHQFSVHTLYKPGPELYIADWLSCHNHTETKDKEISDINISRHTINTTVDNPISNWIEGIKAATNENAELQMLKQYIIRGRSHTKNEVEPGP